MIIIYWLRKHIIIQTQLHTVRLRTPFPYLNHKQEKPESVQLFQNNITIVSLQTRPHMTLAILLVINLFLSKWFYDTSTGAVTGAVRCGSFIGGSFSLLIASY
jgi:hypothetical protein